MCSQVQELDVLREGWMDGSAKVNNRSPGDLGCIYATINVQSVTEHSRCEISRCGGGFGGVRVQSGSPDSTFVTKKRADPVPCVSLAQHGLAICQKEADFHLYAWQLTAVLNAINVRGTITFPMCHTAANAKNAPAPTFAGADEEVAVGSDSTKGQVYHRPSVAGAGERSLSHCHGLPVGLEMARTVRTASKLLTVLPRQMDELNG